MKEIIGWLDPKIADAMRECIIREKPSVMVEIGVFAGKSLINSALALRENGNGIIYGIDPWRNRDALRTLSPNDSRETWLETNLDDIHTSCMRSIWEHRLENVVIIRATSRLACPLFRLSHIDILYIDGGHSEQQSTEDAVSYLPKVKRGGMIWIDDATWPSLQKALHYLGEFCTLERDLGDCRFYSKI